MDRADRFAEAQALYEQAVDVELLAEEMYRRLVLCLSAQGRRAEAMEPYRRCRRQLSAVLGIPPPSRPRRSIGALPAANNTRPDCASALSRRSRSLSVRLL